MTFKQFIGDSSTGVVGAINNIIVPLIFALALAFFVWGVVKYFFIHGDDSEGRTEGGKFVLWGVVGMVVMFGVWGLVNMLLSTLKL